MPNLDYRAIEGRAEEVLADICEHRGHRYALDVPRIKDVCEPELAAEVLGYAYLERDDLGRFGEGRHDRSEVAGLLDHERRVIEVSRRFAPVVRRFTAAHEIGHIVLGHEGSVLHRDRPIYSLQAGNRPPAEREADHFAACLLAPRLLVTAAFETCFGGRQPLLLTDAVAHELCGPAGDDLLYADDPARAFAYCLARADRFGGQRFTPLAEYFQVSLSAMAIRLEELGLVSA